MQENLACKFIHNTIRNNDSPRRQPGFIFYVARFFFYALFASRRNNDYIRFEVQTTMMKRLLIYSFTILCIIALLVGVVQLYQNYALQSLPVVQRSQIRKVFFADHISPAHQAVIQRFNELHKGTIEVIPVNLPFSKFSTNERKELLARSLRSKSDRLDVFSVDYIWTQRFAKWCEPLDTYFPDSIKNNIISPALQSCSSNNQLVAMPLYIDIGLLYYRKDFLRQLPNAAEVEEKIAHSITWNELFELRKRLGMSNRPFYIFQANDYEGLVCNYFEIIASLDRNYFKKNGITLASPTAKQALQMLVDFVHESNISPLQVTEFDENKSYEFMLEHDAMFVRGWPNFIENFRKTYHDTSKFPFIGKAPLPHFQGRTPASVYGGWNLMISKFSSNKEASIEFVRFLQTEEAQKIMFNMGGYIPVNAKVYKDSLYLLQHPDLSFYRQLLNNGFHRPFLEDYTKISDVISHFVHLAIKRELSVDEALQRATAMIESKQVLIK